VVGSTPEEMLRHGYRPVGKDFPVFLHPVTTRNTRWRAPSARPRRAIKASWCSQPEVTLEEDLRRRDLTINAIAEHSDATLIDPFKGREDLTQGLLRHVSDAFVEDRCGFCAWRDSRRAFSRYGFKVAHTTHTLMQRMVESVRSII